MRKHKKHTEFLQKQLISSLSILWHYVGWNKINSSFGCEEIGQIFLWFKPVHVTVARDHYQFYIKKQKRKNLSCITQIADVQLMTHHHTVFLPDHINIFKIYFIKSKTFYGLPSIIKTLEELFCQPYYYGFLNIQQMI